MEIYEMRVSAFLGGGQDTGPANEQPWEIYEQVYAGRVCPATLKPFPSRLGHLYQIGHDHDGVVYALDPSATPAALVGFYAETLVLVKEGHRKLGIGDAMARRRVELRGPAPTQGAAYSPMGRRLRERMYVTAVEQAKAANIPLDPAVEADYQTLKDKLADEPYPD